MKTICIHSYKGGTGKTTISTHLAYALCKKYKEVFLLETDFYMPTFHSLFPETFSEVSILSNLMYSDTQVSFEDIFFPSREKDGLFLAFANPQFNPEDPLFGNDPTWFTKRFRKLILNVLDFKEEHPDSVLIIDTTPGYHFVVINSLLISDLAIVVIRPNVYAIDGSKRIIKEVYGKTRSSKDLDISILFNQVPQVPAFPELVKWKKEFEEMECMILPDIMYDHESAYFSAKGYAIYPEPSVFIKIIKDVVNQLPL